MGAVAEMKGRGITEITRTEAGIEEFLTQTGVVFKRFDKQDSGCISYGLAVEGEKWFVKHAGRPDAIHWMKNAVRVHSDIRHRCLPRMRNAFDTRDGFALVYDWVEGEVLGTPDYPGAIGRNDPKSPHYRFRQLPAERIVSMLTDLYELHVEVEDQGYVAVDLYDGSILYDFSRHVTHFCDLDCYSKGAFHLDLDRNYGSSRFMAPEEFARGSLIDQRTNVYTMGAAAFVFLADGVRTREAWKASDELFGVALKAISADRESRHPTLAGYYREWQLALRDGFC